MLLPTILSGAVLTLLHISSAHGAAICAKSDKLVRKNWTTLTDAEKLEYISAVQCLQAQPAQLSDTYPGAVSRYDDFQGVHVALTEKYHFTGAFHPWHRLYLKQYESDLRSFCNYTGAQPYWDWTQDAGSEEDFLAAQVFSETTGFGGNGPYVDTSNFATTNVPVKIPNKTGGGCVSSGPFVNMSVAMGPGPTTASNPRCLQRDFSPWLATRTLNTSVVDRALAADSFAVFDYLAQGTGLTIDGMTYHGGGHLSVGGDIGELGNMYSSPGDPLFYLHHANLDRLWDQWQRKDWDTRKSDIAGPDTMFAYPFDFNGDVPYSNITLDTTLVFGGLMADAAISATMDIGATNLYYTYA